MTNHIKPTDTLAIFFKSFTLAVCGLVYVPYTSRMRDVYKTAYVTAYGNAGIRPLTPLLRGGSINDMGKERTLHHGAARGIRR